MLGSSYDEFAQSQYSATSQLNMVDEKIVAQKWLDAIGSYEASWEPETDPEKLERFIVGRYTSERSVDQIFADSLTDEEKKSGFAIFLYAFGNTSWNDAQDICNTVLNGGSYILTTTEQKARREERDKELLEAGVVAPVTEDAE